jgi:hypothetical protein
MTTACRPVPREAKNMQESLTLATWLWLFVPMPLCLLLSIITFMMKK